ncbi:MAG: barstar family protein [Anaerococcus hydrogenalis]|uniref:barstar family protein n=1 Tax=Anaerococcus hydrogenalis TaxID=33029 RepID=UPI00290F0FFF|nr:barstar family protein [Anaerococcus hydrogenalis]MDU3687926.1 barstar family protein [Anaerococcus hydrogenalis]
MICLDGFKFKSRDEAFSYLNEKIDFEYEVDNLDGLFDCLSMVDEKIVIENYPIIYENLSDYGEKFLSCFMKASLSFGIEIDFLS